MRKLLLTCILLSLGAAHAQAGSIRFTASGTSNNGPLAAQIDFLSVTGGLEITLTNLALGEIHRGQAISGISFDIGGAVPTAFTKLVGSTANSANFVAGSAYPGSATVTPISDVGSGTIDHWKFSHSLSDVTLATAGSGAAGRAPEYMILPSTGITGPGKSLAQGNFDPYLLGPAHFFLTVPGLTAASTPEISDLSVRFGSGPDKVLSGDPVTVTAVPEPSSVALGAIGLGCMLFVARRKRK